MQLKKNALTVKTKFYSFTPTTIRNVFQKRKTYFNYFRKLAKEQGISFAIGIAIGVIIILLVQTSKDIINKLSEPIAGSILGIAGIISTVIVGITIFYMQKRADKKINRFIEEQHKIIQEQNERHTKKKKYYISRINSYYKRFNQHYNDLKLLIQQYLESKKTSNNEVLDNSKRYKIELFVKQIDDFFNEATEDIKPIMDILDNQRLVDKFTLAISLSTSTLKTELATADKWRHYSNIEIIKKIDTTDLAMNNILQYMEELKEEVNNELYNSL